MKITKRKIMQGIKILPSGLLYGVLLVILAGLKACEYKRPTAIRLTPSTENQVITDKGNEVLKQPNADEVYPVSAQQLKAGVEGSNKTSQMPVPVRKGSPISSNRGNHQLDRGVNSQSQITPGAPNRHTDGDNKEGNDTRLDNGQDKDKRLNKATSPFDTSTKALVNISKHSAVPNQNLSPRFQQFKNKVDDFKKLVEQGEERWKLHNKKGCEKILKEITSFCNNNNFSPGSLVAECLKGDEKEQEKYIKYTLAYMDRLLGKWQDIEKKEIKENIKAYLKKEKSLR